MRRKNMWEGMAAALSRHLMVHIDQSQGLFASGDIEDHRGGQGHRVCEMISDCNGVINVSLYICHDFADVVGLERGVINLP
jgi:hypothetical protein